MRDPLRIYRISPKGRWPEYVVDRSQELALASLARRFGFAVERLKADDVTDEMLRPRRFEDRDAVEGLRRIVMRGIAGHLILQTGGKQIVHGVDAYMRMHSGRPLERTSDAWELRP